MSKKEICGLLTFDEITEEKLLADYGKKHGVWILIGKNKNDSTWEALQVAKNKEIGKEISTAFSWIAPFEEPLFTKHEYYNQFSERVDDGDFVNYPDIHQQVYAKCFREYEELKIIILASDLNADKQPDRIEKYVAYRTRARFWRNGRSYKKEDKDHDPSKVDVKMKKDLDTPIMRAIDDFLDGKVALYEINVVFG